MVERKLKSLLFAFDELIRYLELRDKTDDEDMEEFLEDYLSYVKGKYSYINNELLEKDLNGRLKIDQVGKDLSRYLGEFLLSGSIKAEIMSYIERIYGHISDLK